MSASHWVWAACGARLVQLFISVPLRSTGFPGSGLDRVPRGQRSDSDGQSFSHSSEFSIHTSFFAEQHSAGMLLPLSAVVWKETSSPPRCLKCGMVCRCFIGLSSNITFNSVSYEKTMCPVPISLKRKAGLGPSGQRPFWPFCMHAACSWTWTQYDGRTSGWWVRLKGL